MIELNGYPHITPCECCRLKRATQRHHKFHNVKWAKKKYGKLMEHPSNIMFVCTDCHVSHRSVGLIHYTEREFCEKLGIEIKM